MPIHDWTRVDAGLFHHFHHHWISALSDALNEGVLPPHYFALSEQRIKGPIPDVLTLELNPDQDDPADESGQGGLAVATAPPRAQQVWRSEAEIYAGRVDRITVRHKHGEVVAIIEIVSPGNKGSKAALKSFVEKSAQLLEQGVHLLVIDLLPPSKRDPQGIHKAIWDEFEEAELEMPPGKPLTMVSYDAGAGENRVAYVNFVAVGDVLPDMPLFFQPERYVPAPLEETYQTTWKHFPAALKGLLDDHHER